MELEEFSSLFQLVLSQYDVGTIPVSLDRVTAGETTRQTGHRVKVLFLLGADDSSIPQVGAEPACSPTTTAPCWPPTAWS